MRLTGKCLLLVVLALVVLARGDGKDHTGNVDFPTENNLNHNSIDLRGLGDFFAKIFGTQKNGPQKDRPSGGRTNGGASGGNIYGPGNAGPSGGYSGPGNSGGQGKAGTSGGNGGGLGNAGAPAFEKMLEMVKGITEKLGAMPGGEGSPFGSMPPAMPPMGMLQPQPWMAMFGDDLEPLPPFRIPPYLTGEGPTPTIYDKIDFAAVRPVLEQELQTAMQGIVDPKALRRIIAPKIYKLRAGCTINVMQRLISAGLTRWADQGMEHVGAVMATFAPGEDVYPLVDAIKGEVMGEINRTIFGEEFREFDEMLNFIQMAVKWNLKSDNATITAPALNGTSDKASVVFPMVQYLLQCETRQSFLQKLLNRIATLKRRVLLANPWPFTARIMKSLFPCGDMGHIPNKPEMVHKIFKGTSYALGIIKKELGKMVWNVERAIIFGDDKEISYMFPEFLGNKTGVLIQTLARIRNADGPPPVFPSPPPMPSGPDPMQNDTWDENTWQENGTWENPSPGNDTWENPSLSGNGTFTPGTPSAVPQNDTLPDSSQPTSRSEKLFILLKRLLASEEKRSSHG